MNKNAVITGASDGIGLAIAKEFAKENYDLHLIARDIKKLKYAKESIEKNNIAVHIYSCDLSQTDGLKNLSDEILKIADGIDVLVNSAGLARFINFEDMNESLLDESINLNIKAPYLLTKNLIEGLKHNKGSVINISSFFAERMILNRPSTAYSMTKGALNSFTKSLSFELGKEGIRVNAISPGTIQTKMFESNMQQLTKEQQNHFYKMVKDIYPLGSIGQPDAIAKTALFLASENASWITGAIIRVDGGLTTN